jgi:hypothetical protein
MEKLQVKRKKVYEIKRDIFIDLAHIIKSFEDIINIFLQECNSTILIDITEKY